MLKGYYANASYPFEYRALYLKFASPFSRVVHGVRIGSVYPLLVASVVRDNRARATLDES